MNWKSVSVPEGAKLFKVHTFTYIHKGTTYNLEVDEFADGSFSGHGEQSTDKSSQLASVAGRSLEDTLEALIKSVKK